MAGALPVLGSNVLISDLLAAKPQACSVLDRYGLRGCGGPNGPHETLGVDERRLLDTLNAGPGRHRNRVSLPVLV
jgi:hypothetical protein